MTLEFFQISSRMLLPLDTVSVCSFEKIPTGNTKERAIFALYSILLNFFHFFIFRKTYGSGILREFQLEFQSELCMCPNLSSGHLQNDRSIFEQYIVVRKLLAALFLSNCSHFGILLFFKF